MLQIKGIEFLDGSIGSYIRSQSDAPKNETLWGSELIVSEPELVKRVHREYVEAGSTIITTCTYQASIQGYCDHFNLTEEEARTKVATAVELATQCFSSTHSSHNPTFQVAAVIGSFGAHLCNMSEYDGSFVDKFPSQKMEKWHDDFVTAFCGGSHRPDLIGFETIPVIAELECILKVVAKYPQHSFYISFSCSSNSTICSGEQFDDALRVISQSELSNLKAVGINCSSINLITPLLVSAKDVIKQLNIPILIMPNLKQNLTVLADGASSVMSNMTAEDVFFDVIEQNCLEWYQLGVRWFGGCCGTKPEHITRMKKIIEQKIV